MGRIWVATTTRYDDENEVRTQLALSMVQAARTLGIRAVTADRSSNPRIAELLTSEGAEVIREKDGATMGAGRRQALAYVKHLAAPDDAIVWMEPEKAPLVQFLPNVCALILSGEADIVVPARTEEGFASYPRVQVLAEQCGNAIFERCTGSALDVWFGPRAMNHRGAEYILAYRGEYGDRWDAVFVPLLRALKNGLRVTGCTVGYAHPSEQARAEAGNVEVGIKKRLEQLASLGNALCEETQRLELLSAVR
ncbi:MAG: hypothetical protein Q8R32_00340 [bacterium]|nr:hypothetical protein [bacterium]